MESQKQLLPNIPIEDKLLSLDFSKGVNLDDNNSLKRDEGIVKDCYMCIRPGNKTNVPKVYCETLNDGRLLTHNYGHGGIGWSTLWGSIIKSIDFAEEKLFKNGSDWSSKKIAIIGGGANGLGTVLNLIARGADPKNIEVFTEKTEDTTSYRSGAILSTASVLDVIDPSLEKLYYDINYITFNTWKSIDDGEKFQKLKTGLKKVKAYFGAEKDYGTIETDSGMDIFVEAGMIPKPELVYVKFNETYNLMRKYDSYYFNAYKLMNALYDMVRNDYGVKINVGKIEKYSQIDSKFEVLFNNTGLNNRIEGEKDKDILPVGGHLITLKHQNISAFDYIIYTHYIYKEDVGKYKYHEAPLFYLMLKTDDVNYGGLLGGTLSDGYDGGDSERDEREYRGIIRRTLEIFGQDAAKFI
jgi:hypothetical protein